MNQCQKIHKYMEDYGSITPIDAIREFGCLRLAARISNLRESGIKIGKKTVRGKNRFGEPVSYAEYYLEEIS